MDELPRHAQALLDLTKDAHDPHDPRARARVAARLSALALLPRVSEPTSPLPLRSTATTGAGSLVSAKVLVTSVLALTVGGGLWGLSARRVSEAAQRTASSVQTTAGTPFASTRPAPEVVALPATPTAPVTRAAAAARAPLTAVPGMRKARPERPPSPASSLAEETALLRRANEQLARGELDEALATLADHRRRFARSQLGEERSGLRVLAHCMRSPGQAQPEARAFVARAPDSVLVTRLVSACEL